MVNPPFILADADADAVRGALPTLGRELCDAMGLRPALKLMHQWGGSRVFIPSTLCEASALADLLGHEAATALVSRFGGATLEPPSLRSIERLLRDNAIRADFDAGASRRELVRRFALTDRQVRSVLSASAASEPRTFPGVGERDA